MEHQDQTESQLIPSQQQLTSSSTLHMFRPPSDSSSSKYRSSTSDDQYVGPGPSLDLQLSVSGRPIQAPSNCGLTGPFCAFNDSKSDKPYVDALKCEAAEQIRLAAIEKAYAERVRELTRREMELAQSDFARARQMWQRAREEVERAERMKESATIQVDSTCMEITCQSCRQRFKPK